MKTQMSNLSILEQNICAQFYFCEAAERTFLELKSRTGVSILNAEKHALEMVDISELSSSVMEKAFTQFNFTPLSAHWKDKTECKENLMEFICNRHFQRSLERARNDP